MTTTAAAENVAGRAIGKREEKKEEKVEKRRALGRGLESLLPGPRIVTSVQTDGDGGATQVPHSVRDDNNRDPSGVGVELGAVKPGPPVPTFDQQPDAAISIQAQTTPSHMVVNLAIESIDKNPYQTRYVFDQEQLIELRDSIKEHGVVQPVVVRPAEEDGRYTLVLGERRLRASKMADKETIPALVRRLSPQQAAEMTVLENVVREDLNPLEQAEAYRVLSREFHLTQAQIAERIGVSRETVSNYMRLLRLPKEVMGYMLEDRLSFSDAREILRLENEEHILLVAKEVVTKRLKWDEIEDRVMRLNGSLPPLPGLPRDGSLTPGAENKNRGARWMDPNVRAAQMEMERTLGMRVRIKDRNGKGRIVIEYASVDDYERVVEMLKK
jgi:ParB family transcriptional regulator, chromosome partitioning protein